MLQIFSFTYQRNEQIDNLENPFLALLYHFRVDEEGIKTVFDKQEICFKFISSPKIKELNALKNQVNLIKKKTINQIYK